MLLLLKSPATGLAAATVGISLGLTAIAGTTASLGITLGLTPPESVELNVFVTPDIRIGLTAISSGFLTRTATLTTNLDLPASGGFGASPVMDIHMGLSGTVGLFLQAAATPAITLGLTGAGVVPGRASLSTVLGLSGAPDVSGGTVNPSASLSHTLTLTAGLTGLGFGTLGMVMDITGTGQYAIPTLATQMRLSFSADEIRTFFRRG